MGNNVLILTTKSINMKYIASILVVIAVTVSCSSNNSTQELSAIDSKVNQLEQTFQPPVVDATKKLTVEVSGMACEMACGGAIRKDLYTTNAVGQVDFDFKMGREFNPTTIYFDDSKISEKEIIERIEKLNKEQFTVKNPTTEVIVAENNSTKAESNSGAKKIYTESTEIGRQLIVSFSGQLMDLIVRSILRR